ncbi:MAG: hypothetical protein IJ518_08095 [Clostridia bacterium]|nr:hypothetical protein [Clostridia bacterium]
MSANGPRITAPKDIIAGSVVGRLLARELSRYRLSAVRTECSYATSKSNICDALENLLPLEKC